MVRGAKPVREMIREAIDALGGRGLNTEIRDCILDRYPGTLMNTISCQIIRCTVNHPSRVHYGENSPRACDDERYDFLYRTRRGEVELYDPEKHGRWAVVRAPGGRLRVTEIEPGNETGVQNAPAKTAPEPVDSAVDTARLAPQQLSRTELIETRVEEVISNFATYLDIFDAERPFQKVGQFELHSRTIRLRQTLGSVRAAVEEPQFVRSLWETLRAWGIGKRRSKPLAAEIWRLANKLRVVRNKSIVVSATKLLHHLLPDLVVPIDHMYTGVLFNWHGNEFQDSQERLFFCSFAQFQRIAQAVDLLKYIGAGWRTSPTKVNDNAVVGYCLEHGLV